MVTPIELETLPGEMRGSALRNWLRTDGAGLFTAFPSGAQALSYARDLGFAMRTQDFYTIRRQVLSLVATAQKLLNYPDNQLIPYQSHEVNTGLKMQYDFEYRIHLFGADTATGLLKDQYMTVTSDNILTKNQVRDTARAYAAEGGKSGDIVDFHFAEIYAMRR
jgi:hypothetical protein